MVAHTFNSNTWEAEAGPELYNEAISQNKTNKIDKKPKPKKQDYFWQQRT